MLRERVTDISSHDGDDRCEHQYGGIWERCTAMADYEVEIETDLGTGSVLVCEDHRDKFDDWE